MSREEKIQQSIRDYLDARELYSYQITYTHEFGGGGLLAITFYPGDYLEKFLGFIDYKSKCDKKGYYVLSKTDTVILSGIALNDLLILISDL